MQKTRRNLLQLASLSPFLALAAGIQRAEADINRFGKTPAEAKKIAANAHHKLAANPDLQMHGSEEIAMLVYPKMTMLDMVGPQFFFKAMMGTKVHLVTKDPTLKPIMGDTGFAIVPTMSMEDCPKDLDILFVGGGTAGTVDVMSDQTSIDFVADRGSRAKHVTSVCTGSMILGQAGLLDGKKATSHWSIRHLLSDFGATPINARVVQDGNVTTGAGVSAGLDFALTLLEQLRGTAYAQTVQLAAEYAPEPPLKGGTPESTPSEIREPMHAMYSEFILAAQSAIAN